MLSHAVANLAEGADETASKPLFTQSVGRRYIRYFHPPC